MAFTYEPIATQTLSGSAASITFSSIPQTYTDLVIVGSYYVTYPTNRLTQIQVGNGSIDTGANYSSNYMGGNSSSTFAGKSNNDSGINGPNHYSNFSASFVYLFNYTNTTTYKTILTRGGTTNGNEGATTGTWRNTAAINTVLWQPNGDNFGINSTFTLYGIKAA
jgi:hypothetical protein